MTGPVVKDGSATPILVLAPPGSDGQTVAAALGRHPDAYDLPQLNVELEATVYDLVFDMIGPRSAQLHGTLRALALLLSGEQSMTSIDMARRWLMRRLARPSAEVATWMLSQLAPQRAVVPVSGGLFTTRSRARLAETYPGADLVIVRRSPARFHAAVMADHAGAAATLLGAYTGSDGTPATPDPMQLWEMAEDAMEALVALMPRARVVDVVPETLAETPLAELHRLADALGLSTASQDVAAMLHPQASPFAGPGPYGAHSSGLIRPLDALAIAPTDPLPDVPAHIEARAARI
ncbi:MAG: sulfotransferase [Pseudomonadota bacterium]